MFPPACGTVGVAVFAIDTSEVAATPACVVEAVAVSLPVLSSGVPVIDAVLVNVSVAVVLLAGTETVIVIVAELLPAASVPTLQVTVPELLVQPALADTNVTPAGSVSETVTPVAAVFPVWEAVIV